MSDKKTKWGTVQSAALYRIHHWASGYFCINSSGNVEVTPQGGAGDDVARIDLKVLIEELLSLGVSLPILLRFTDILQHRVATLIEAFQQAIQRYNYQGNYIAAYPIKVNQQRKVVEAILTQPSQRVALEIGSKTELLLAIALSKKDRLIICNGYKDKAYIKLALMASRLGQKVVLVMEKPSELDLIIACHKEYGFGDFPKLGVRVRLASVVSGKWQNSGGEHSKFGFYTEQILILIQRLRENHIKDRLTLLHFHIGSQVSSLQPFKEALEEGARFYLALRNAGVSIAQVDIGGGLGIDYEGRAVASFCSVNYSMQEYADIALQVFSQVCQQGDVPHPTLITEVGRAMTAHHAILVTDVIESECHPGVDLPDSPGEKAPKILQDLYRMIRPISDEDVKEYKATLCALHADLKQLFIKGKLSLSERAYGERLYFFARRQLHFHTQSSVMETKSDFVSDKFFCNFSLFQSLPDAWAIDQIFPIMPLHRLHEKPTILAKVHDLTCDSDGCVEQYVVGDAITSSLPLHQYKNDLPYFLGVFLVGAYQDTLGDMHNLFGEPAAVDIALDSNSSYRISGIDQGDRIADVLHHVHLERDEAVQLLLDKVRAASITKEQRTEIVLQLFQMLDSSTYLG